MQRDVSNQLFQEMIFGLSEDARADLHLRAFTETGDQRELAEYQRACQLSDAHFLRVGELIENDERK